MNPGDVHRCILATRLGAISGRNKLLHVELFAMLFSMPELILGLLIQSAYCRGIQSDREPDSHFWADAGLAVQHSAQGVHQY